MLLTPTTVFEASSVGVVESNLKIANHHSGSTIAV